MKYEEMSCLLTLNRAAMTSFGSCVAAPLVVISHYTSAPESRGMRHRSGPIRHGNRGGAVGGRSGPGPYIHTNRASRKDYEEFLPLS
jgi:hypothetical protein